MAEEQEAFVESGEEEVPRRAKNLRLPINEDGTIDWESAQDKQKKAFIEAIKNDPNGILQNIQEEAGEEVSGPMVADATVVALANSIFIVEGLAYATIGARVVPVLRHLNIIVSIKACTVTLEEMQPVMEPAKRLIARYMPPKFLEYQDFAVVGEHLLKLSAAKFKACIDLAMEIEKMKASGEVHQPVNGRAMGAGQ